MTDAPIKETLAAALLYLQGWHTQEFDTIIDPMCGSGTLLIEAMLMRTKLPVQIAHEFAFEKIGMHDESLWQQTRTQMVDAHNQALDALLHKGVAVYGFDIDKGAVHATMQNFCTPLPATIQTRTLCCAIFISSIWGYTPKAYA